MKRLVDICSLPEFIEPWITHFYAPHELDLLNTLDRRQMNAAGIRNELGPAFNDSLIDRAWRRGVINRLDDGRFAPAEFHDRFEKWALFEGWQDLPETIKKQLNQWELDYYVKRHHDRVEQLRKGRSRPMEEVCPEYLLLDEVNRLFKRIPHFYLWPCNCRAMIEECTQTRLTCIRFSNDRDIGWEISRERALDIVYQANRQGLMQSAELAVGTDGQFDGALCNCCSDCCFPHQLASQLQAEKIWPLSRYLAQQPTDTCNGCGRCIRRCPFGAISQETKLKGTPAAAPVIDNDLCRGCGVCATDCPQEAIRMQKVRASAMEVYYA